MATHPHRNTRNAEDKYATVLVQASGRRYHADGWSSRAEPLFRVWVEAASYADMLRQAEGFRRTAGPGCLRHGDEEVESVVVLNQRRVV
jgi:hypothetical protein